MAKKIIIVKENKLKSTGRPDYSLDFEFTCRGFLGDKASRIADYSRNPAQIKKWLLKLSKQIIRDINSIETTPRHKRILLLKCERIFDNINKGNFDMNLILSLFGLINILLGYDYMNGKKYYNALYVQEKEQYFQSFFMENPGKTDVYFNKEESLSKEKHKIIQNLNKQGFDSFHISVIMNISEYEAKKIISDK